MHNIAVQTQYTYIDMVGKLSNLFVLASKHERKASLKLAQINLIFAENVLYVVKPAHAVTSIKQSPVLKGQLFLVLS